MLSQLSPRKLDIERRNPTGRTPLLSACRSALWADASIDAFLTDVTTDVHKGGYLRDPFIAQSPDLTTTILDSLLSLSADPLVTDIYGKNALHNLLEAHNPVNNDSRAPFIHRSLRRLASEYPQLVNPPDNQNTYPLHSALQRLR